MVCCGHSSLLWAMSFAAFHPIVQRWFTTAIGTPTSAQLSGWASIRDGRHTLIAAPTGSGKTLAAFLSALDELTRDALVAPLADEVRVVYVSPLKALSAERSRQMLRTVRTVIVDEIHAVIGTRRGAHLALSLERLQQVAERPLLRIGLSATQKPIAEVANYLTAGGSCTVIDEGHRRE